MHFAAAALLQRESCQGKDEHKPIVQLKQAAIRSALGGRHKSEVSTTLLNRCARDIRRSQSKLTAKRPPGSSHCASDPAVHEVIPGW